MKLLALITLILGISLVGCTTREPTPSVSAIQAAIAQTQQAQLPTPTITPVTDSEIESLPVPTDQPLPSPTLSSIATVIAEPKPIFEYARIYGMGHLQTGYLLITIEVPGELMGSYQGIVGNETFKCEIFSKYPNRLYCTGQTSDQGKFVDFTLLESFSQNRVFQTRIGIPPSPYSAQNVKTREDKFSDKAPNQPSPTSTLPVNPYP